MRRLPLILWRSTFLDLLKLVGLTTAVLVLVIALGAAVKPLSDGILQASDLPKFILVACVPMLAYALPFAGGFATTLVYYRIANENESVAAHASGISHRSLLAPAFTLALVLTCSLIVLNEQVIPVFLRTMQKLVTVDVARQLLQGVTKGEAVQFKSGLGGGSDNRMMIYADSAAATKPTGGATDQIAFSNFVFVQTDKAGKPVQELTCSLAHLWLFPATATDQNESEGESLVLMRFENATAYADRAGLFAFADQNLAQTIPNTFIEKVGFMSWRELRTLASMPQRINWVDLQRQRLISALAERMTLATMRDAVASQQPIHFTDSNGKPVTIQAGSFTYADDRWTLRPPPGGALKIQRVRTSTMGSSSQTISAESGTLIREQLAPQQPPIFKLQLERAKVRDSSAQGDTASGTERAVIVLEGLNPSPNHTETLRELPAPELLKKADAWLAAGDTLDKAPAGLADALWRLDRVILAKQNERMAMALSCAVMILTGAVTSLLLSRKLPLTVYLWTFVPALATIVTISGGQQLVTQIGAPGLFLMWSGVTALGVYTLAVFWWLAKH